MVSTGANILVLVTLTLVVALVHDTLVVNVDIADLSVVDLLS